MEKLTGWTKGEFIGCDQCKEEGHIVCQASRVRHHSKNGTQYFCQHHADIIDPPAKREARKRKRQKELAKTSNDDQYRDWASASGAWRYV